jgi:hypothetical protein
MKSKPTSTIWWAAGAMLFWWASTAAWAELARAATWSVIGVSVPGAALNQTIYVFTVLAGALLHWINERAKGKTSSETFVDYWLHDAPGSSVATLVTLLMGIGSTLQAGIVDSMAPWAVFVLALQNGYMTNSLVNQGAPSAAGAAAAPSPTPTAAPAAASVSQAPAKPGERSDAQTTEQK